MAMASCPSVPRRRAASASPGNVLMHYRGPRHRSPVARSGGGGVERLGARRATRSRPPSPDHRTMTRATRSTTSGACSSRVVGARLQRSRLHAARFTRSDDAVPPPLSPSSSRRAFTAACVAQLPHDHLDRGRFQSSLWLHRSLGRRLVLLTATHVVSRRATLALDVHRVVLWIGAAASAGVLSASAPLLSLSRSRRHVHAAWRSTSRLIMTSSDQYRCKR